MARVTPDDVLEIIDVDSSLTDLYPFIAAANALVTQTIGAYGLEDSLLKEIERWLAAHFVAIRDPRYDMQSIGDAKASYTVKVGEGLGATRYGQQVLLLDVTKQLEGGGRSALIEAPA